MMDSHTKMQPAASKCDETPLNHENCGPSDCQAAILGMPSSVLYTLAGLCRLITITTQGLITLHSLNGNGLCNNLQK